MAGGVGSNAPDGRPTNYQLTVSNGSGTNSLNQFNDFVSSWSTGSLFVN